MKPMITAWLRKERFTLNTDTQLEISERAAFWQLKYEHIHSLLIDQGFSEGTAKVIARERADAEYKIRFPYDYK